MRVHRAVTILNDVVDFLQNPLNCVGVVPPFHGVSQWPVGALDGFVSTAPTGSVSVNNGIKASLAERLCRSRGQRSLLALSARAATAKLHTRHHRLVVEKSVAGVGRLALRGQVDTLQRGRLSGDGPQDHIQSDN